MTVGVYEIVCLKTRKRYIGGSQYYPNGVERRLAHHRCMLKSGKHCNKLLQADYDSYGPQSFVYEIIYACAASQVHYHEQQRIDWWRSLGKLYNIQPNAGTSRGTKRNTSSKQRASDAAKARCTPEWKAAVSARVKRQHEEGKFGRQTWRKN